MTEEETEERERTFTRKAIIRAGWAVPVAMAVAPSVAFAASGVHQDHLDARVHADVA